MQTFLAMLALCLLWWECLGAAEATAARLAQGKRLYHKGVKTRAQADLRAAARHLQAAPLTAEVHFYLGRVMTLLGEQQEAAQHYLKSLALESNVKSLENLANVYVGIGPIPESHCIF